MIQRRNFLSALGAGTALLAAPAIGRAQGAPFKIGTILSVTGPGAFLGDHMRRGMELAVEEINAGGGINGRRIEWIFYDAETQTTRGVTATRRLIEQDQVHIIVGGGNASGIALAMVPFAERAATPFMSTEGSMQIVNPVGERRWTFKSTADDDQVLERAIDFWERRNVRSAALLFDSSGFGQSAREQMERVAPRRNMRVIYETFNPADTDMTAQLTRLRAANVDTILCWTITPAGVVFLKQARQLGLGDKIIMHGYGFVDERYMNLAEGTAENTFLMSVKFPVGADLPDADPMKAKIAELTQKYQRRYNLAPNQFVAQTYDAINLAAAALRQGGDNKEAVRTALEAVRNFQGAGGVFNFSAERHSGLSKNDICVVTWRDGRFRLADYQ
jgi:branched-chain amino acid transport system substrate-binding protein